MKCQYVPIINSPTLLNTEQNVHFIVIVIFGLVNFNYKYKGLE